MPEAGSGAHTIQTICRDLHNGAERTETYKISAAQDQPGPDPVPAHRIVAVRHDSLSGFKTRMLGGAPGVQEFALAHADQWKWWDPATNTLFHPWSIMTVVRPADSFEVARPDKGISIRIRPWWHTDKQIMKYPIVTLRQLSVDGRPVEYDYIERRNRMGVVTDS